MTSEDVALLGRPVALDGLGPRRGRSRAHAARQGSWCGRRLRVSLGVARRESRRDDHGFESAQARRRRVHRQHVPGIVEASFGLCDNARERVREFATRLHEGLVGGERRRVPLAEERPHFGELRGGAAHRLGPPDDREDVAPHDAQSQRVVADVAGKHGIEGGASHPHSGPHRVRLERQPAIRPRGISARDEREQRATSDRLVVLPQVRLAIAIEEHRVARRGAEVVLDDERRPAEVGVGSQPRVALLLVAQTKRDERAIVILEVRALRLRALLEVHLLGRQRERRAEYAAGLIGRRHHQRFEQDLAQLLAVALERLFLHANAPRAHLVGRRQGPAHWIEGQRSLLQQLDEAPDVQDAEQIDAPRGLPLAQLPCRAGHEPDRPRLGRRRLADLGEMSVQRITDRRLCLRRPGVRDRCRTRRAPGRRAAPRPAAAPTTSTTDRRLRRSPAESPQSRRRPARRSRASADRPPDPG